MKNNLLFFAALALPLLFANCSSKDGGEEEPTPTSTILSIDGHRFSSDVDEDFESARFFSTSLNRSIKVADVTAENAPKIDLGLGTISTTLFFFMSPDHEQYGIKNPGATKTEYMLDWNSEKITEAEFAAISESSDFDKYTFTANNESFPYNAETPFFCFFRNAAGKKGVMKITGITQVGMNPGVTVDIKVQK